MQDEAGAWVGTTQEGPRTRLSAEEARLYLLEVGGLQGLNLDALK